MSNFVPKNYGALRPANTFCFRVSFQLLNSFLTHVRDISFLAEKCFNISLLEVLI